MIGPTDQRGAGARAMRTGLALALAAAGGGPDFAELDAALGAVDPRLRELFPCFDSAGDAECARGVASAGYGAWRLAFARAVRVTSVVVKRWSQMISESWRGELRGTGVLLLFPHTYCMHPI